MQERDDFVEIVTTPAIERITGRADKQGVKLESVRHGRDFLGMSLTR